MGLVAPLTLSHVLYGSGEQLLSSWLFPSSCGISGTQNVEERPETSGPQRQQELLGLHTNARRICCMEASANMTRVPEHANLHSAIYISK